jgi:hypothetical protein
MINSLTQWIIFWKCFESLKVLPTSERLADKLNASNSQSDDASLNEKNCGYDKPSSYYQCRISRVTVGSP